jgi:S-DNA-T family DNA segregation ATPase FtsK/SpoIIIE
MLAEIFALNEFFRQNNIKAKVADNRSRCIVGYLEYGLTIAVTEKITRIEAVRRELVVLLGNTRKTLGIAGEVTVYPVFTPFLALQVSHPEPRLLSWSKARFETAKPHSGIVGRNYTGEPVDEILDLYRSPHILIAGTTKAGKSMLLQHFLLSLSYATSPEELKIMLVDLKQEDLVPLKNLPHVTNFAGTVEQAVEVIGQAFKERNLRVEQYGRKPYRLVVVIDEMADLPAIAVDMLSKISTIGRSKLINLIGVTQSPTEVGGFGKLLRSNFNVRLVGMVAPGQAHIATARGKSFAELLSTGSFLWVEGARMERFQSFYFPPDGMRLMMQAVKLKWQNIRHDKLKPLAILPDIKPDMGMILPDIERDMGVILPDIERDMEFVTPVQSPGYTPEELANNVFPLHVGRKLVRREILILRELAKLPAYQVGGVPKWSVLTMRVYGSRNPQRTQYIKEALSE